MTNTEKLNKTFETLNKKYVKISNQIDVMANKNKDTWDLECTLDEIQIKMSNISAQIELN